MLLATETGLSSGSCATTYPSPLGCTLQVMSKSQVINRQFPLFVDFTEGLVFTQTPNGTLYYVKGSDAFFNWSYRVDNRTAELGFVIWSRYNNTNQQEQILFYEDVKGDIHPGFNRPPSYIGRVRKEGQATLVVENVTFEDTAKYSCTLDGKSPVPDVDDIVQLVVTGSVRFC